MPPYWSLGFHLCRWGYLTANRTMEVVQSMRDHDVPQDTQWNDIDYMNMYLDFTYNHTSFKELPELVDDLHNHGQKYIVITVSIIIIIIIVYLTSAIIYYWLHGYLILPNGNYMRLRIELRHYYIITLNNYNGLSFSHFLIDCLKCTNGFSLPLFHCSLIIILYYYRIPG